MSYINGKILEWSAWRNRMTEDVAELEFKLSRAETWIVRLENELRNIPEAVREHGYVTLQSDGGLDAITLVEKT